MEIQELRALIKESVRTVWATVREGKIELLEPTELLEGTRVLVTLLPEDETGFWLEVSQPSLDAVWNNSEDDVYAQPTQLQAFQELRTLSSPFL